MLRIGAEGLTVATRESEDSCLFTAAEWLRGIEAGGPLRARLVQACGGESALSAGRTEAFRKTLKRFAREFGAGREVRIARVPGRLNTLGRHIDHRGGYVNPVALAQEVVLVFAPARDALVDVHNLDDAFGRRTFRIADLGSMTGAGDTQAWLDWTQGLAAERAARGTAHDWGHKLAAPCAYLSQFLFPDRKLKGYVGAMVGAIPPRVGLSSSSAVVIASMLAMGRVNGLEFSTDALVDHCGRAEWYVGTRGGSGDHAAILCARVGHIMQARTVPELRVARHAAFPANLRFLVFHSGYDADKTGPAGNTFNERTATYEIAEMLARRHLREHHPALWETFARSRRGHHKTIHLGDMVEHLRSGEIFAMLEDIPERADRRGLREMLRPDSSEKDLERQFATHRELPGGYRLRGVLLFGLAECARAIRWSEALAAGDLARIGRVMNVSHDGDRVSGSGTDRASLKSRVNAALDISEHPGGYDCSTPEIDRMVDIALAHGAIGAQVTAAGLGGSMMALVETGHEQEVIAAMTREYFAVQDVPANHLVAVPSAGASCV